MKKLFRSYLVIWAILLALFNVITFAVPTWNGLEKYTASFWVGYGFIMFALVGQLACAWFALGKSDNSRKLFYHFSLLTVSRTGLLATFVCGGACMLVSLLPWWVGVILCATVLAFTAIAVVKANTAAELACAIDDTVKTNTFFVKSLTADAQSLLARAGSAELGAACKKVYEAVRYSDPVSHRSLASVEGEITLRFAALADAVKTGDVSVASALADELVILLRERNNKCKISK